MNATPGCGRIDDFCRVYIRIRSRGFEISQSPGRLWSVTVGRRALRRSDPHRSGSVVPGRGPATIAAFEKTNRRTIRRTRAGCLTGWQNALAGGWQLASILPAVLSLSPRQRTGTHSQGSESSGRIGSQTRRCHPTTAARHDGCVMASSSRNPVVGPAYQNARHHARQDIRRHGTDSDRIPRRGVQCHQHAAVT